MPRAVNRLRPVQIDDTAEKCNSDKTNPIPKLDTRRFRRLSCDTIDFMAFGVTRRVLLAGIAAAAARGAVPPRVFPPERVRYSDPSTEFWVLRLTSPEHSCFLPRPPLRFLHRRRSFIIYSSDRTGSHQLYQMISTTGESRQLTSAADCDASWFCLEPDDRGVLFFDGPSLRHLYLPSMREHELYRVPAGWNRVPGLGVAREGGWAFVPETDGTTWRIRGVSLAAKPLPPNITVESSEPIRQPQARPRHAGVLFGRGPNGVCIAAGAGQAQELTLEPGETRQCFWSADGERIAYLCVPAEQGRLNSIREFAVDSRQDKLIGQTSQYASFSPNTDASVFAGASANKASPHVVLMVRAARRELTLCEHKASDAGAVFPVFSHDSQRVYFQSDRHGKPAIYSVGVERLVERTE